MFSKGKGREGEPCFGLIAGSTPVVILHNVRKFVCVAIQFGLTWGKYLSTTVVMCEQISNNIESYTCKAWV